MISLLYVVNGEKMQGLQSMTQNLMNGKQQLAQNVASKAVQGAQQFVDTAGNVYTVIRDASGAATNFVMDAAGTIFDVTKMAGTFLLNNAKAYPGEVMASAQQTAQDLRNMAGVGRDAAQAFMQFAKDARPELPPLGKDMLHPKTWVQTAQKNAMKMSGAFDGLSSQYYDVYSQFEDKYCTPASFTPAEKKPAKITGPGFKLEIGLGGCVVTEHDAKTKTMSLDCIQPYAAWSHVQATYTSKYHSAPKFVSKECKIKKEHGKADEITLLEFNGHQAPDAKTMTSAVQSQLQAALSGLTSMGQKMGDQVGSFLSGLDHNEKNSLDALVKSYEGMPQPTF